MQNIILLHGALGAAADLEPLRQALLGYGFSAHTFSFSGHGKTSFNEAFGISAFTAELENFIAEKTLAPVSVFGYSMGGYVALNLAAKENSRLEKIITLGTKFAWDARTVEKETKLLDPDIMLSKIPGFAASLEKKHGDRWRELVAKTAGLIKELGKNNILDDAALKKINNKVLIGIGDNDQMVTLEETVLVYKALPNSGMYMLPGTRHMLESADTAVLGRIIAGCLDKT